MAPARAVPNPQGSFPYRSGARAWALRLPRGRRRPRVRQTRELARRAMQPQAWLTGDAPNWLVVPGAVRSCTRVVVIDRSWTIPEQVRQRRRMGAGAGCRLGRSGDASSHVSRMTEGVASRLRPHANPVGFVPDGDGVHPACPGVEDVDDIVIAATEPQLLSVGGDVAHVRATAAGNPPGRLDSLCSEVHDAHTSLPIRWTRSQLRPPPVADVQPRAIATYDQAVCTGSGTDESDHFELVTVDQIEATAGEIRDVENPAVRRDAHILGNSRPTEPERRDHSSMTPVDLDQLALKLARDDEVRAVNREVAVVHASAVSDGKGCLERERVWIPELKSSEKFLDHDHRPTIGREVQVVRAMNCDGRARRGGPGIDGRDAAVLRMLYRRIDDPQRPEVVGRHDVFGVEPDWDARHHPQRSRVDHRHVVRSHVRDIHRGEEPLVAGLSLRSAAALYRFEGSDTPGIPGTVRTRVEAWDTPPPPEQATSSKTSAAIGKAVTVPRHEAGRPGGFGPLGAGLRRDVDEIVERVRRDPVVTAGPERVVRDSSLRRRLNSYPTLVLVPVQKYGGGLGG